MSDPNEGDQTLVKEVIEPEKTGEERAQNQQDNQQPPKQSEQKKLERNQSGLRSSINRSRSEDSLRNDVNLADSIPGDDVMKQSQQEDIKQIADDYFYSDLDIQEFQKQSESAINENIASLDKLYGHDSFKNYNSFILDRDTIIYCSGISYTIYNHFTKEKRVFYSQDKGGIAAIAVHPSKKYFAVGQKGVWPNIYIYEFPSLKLYRVIRRGTERSYSCLNFSGNGNMLASVGSYPDYLLTVWNWKQQRMVLKSKAFSQQVYRVNFSQFNEKWITTSGTGHIRFWRISSTFTGMKLQGDIGKFGQFQISDVVSFAEFEDANVVSSSQYGKLLLWEGNLIKSVIGIDQQTPCHNGSIQFVKMIGKQIVSAGSDGYIRFWDSHQLNTGESDEQFNFYMKPSKQVYFEAPYGGPAHLLWIDICENFWIVQDAKGSTWKYQLEEDKRTQILKYNSGKFTDFALSPLNNCLITTGQDGLIRLWDYGSQRQFYNAHFLSQSSSTCIEWIPFSKKNHGRLVVVGFSDGIIRFSFLNSKSFQLVRAFKIHNNPILKIKSNREGTIIAAVDTSGSIFFLSMDSPIISKITPYCLFETGFKINDVSWDRNGQKILLGCQDGRLHQVNVPKEKNCDHSETYVKDFESRSLTIKMMESQKPNREELELELMLKKTKGIQVDESVLDVEWQPAPILNCIYYDTDCTKILCSAEGKYLGNYYIMDFNKERPISGIQSEKIKTSYLGFMESQNLLFIGLRNGTWQIRSKLNPNTSLKKLSFDQDYGIVRKVSMNLQNTALLSASQDGTLICHKFDYESFKKGTKGDSVDNVQISIPSVILGISQSTFGDKIQLGKDVGEDIADNKIYSLKDQKLKAGQNLKMTEAEKVKYKKIKKVQQLREIFKSVVAANNKESDRLAKLTVEELTVDPQYSMQIQKRIQDDEEETRKVLAWDQQYAKQSRKKIQDYFVDELQFKKFTVKGIKIGITVSSFKLKKLSPFVLIELQKIENIIKEEEELNKRHDRKNKTTSSFVLSKAYADLKQKDTKKGGKQENQEVKNKIRQAEVEFEKQLTQAIAMKGDYKLKCSPTYVVPETERLNVSRKKKHLFLHYQYIFLEKKEFNNKVNILREKKINMVTRLSGVNAKINEINFKLGQKQEYIIVQINEEIEGMEADIEINQQDIEEHIIQKQKQKEANKKGSGMGMGGGQDDQGKKTTQIKKQRRIVRPQIIKRQVIGPNLKLRTNPKLKKSELRGQVDEIEKILLNSEKEKLQSQIFTQIEIFDKQLEELYTIRQTLEANLTLVQMKILTYAQQFIIFRDMETYDNQLMKQLTTFGSDKDKHEDNFIQLSNQIQQIEGVLEELKKKHEDEKKVLKQFVYPEDDEMRQKILRYYKIRQRKRISKLKKQAEQQQKQKQEEEDPNSDEDEEDDSDQDSDQDSEDEQGDQDDEEKPDITVIENDHKNFQRVRKICEYDEKIEQNSKKKSELEKQRNQITNKIKNLDQQLDKAEVKLKDYQKKKLLKINQLIVSYPALFSQINYTAETDGKLKIQDDFNQAILFTRAAFNKLSDRIEELKTEKIEIQKKKTLLNKKLSKLNESMVKSSSQIENRRKQYQEKQLLKFGSTFELDKLKELEPNNQVLQARQLYKKQQRQVSRKIQGIKEELQQRKRQLLDIKKHNTKVISEITDLGERQNELKKKLDSTNKQLFKNYDASKKDQLDKERQNLKDLIKFLSKEIEDLKTEIGLFKRKGGHIYTMVTSNKKNFS